MAIKGLSIIRVQQIIVLYRRGLGINAAKYLSRPIVGFLEK